MASVVTRRIEGTPGDMPVVVLLFWDGRGRVF
jgi:hypothetical protein